MPLRGDSPSSILEVPSTLIGILTDSVAASNLTNVLASLYTLYLEI